MAIPHNAQPAEVNPAVGPRQPGEAVDDEEQRLRHDLEAEELRIRGVYADRNRLIPADHKVRAREKEYVRPMRQPT
jgi:hypothetical protein